MKLSSLIATWPVFSFILLVLLLLLIPSLLIPCWIIKVKRIEQEVVLSQGGLENFVTKDITIAFILVISMVGGMVFSLTTFVLLIIRASRREMCLCAALIKQMEATQQAERKSLKKSLALASASHDIRASIAGIIGLIDICRDQVAPSSDLGINLKQMEENTKDLLGILKSILDASKIEAGKMQLEEEEFDLAQLLEDVVDLYYPIGMKKGLDVVMDPCDGSLSKFSKVKGDRTKIKQILCNLLSNAIKFTSEGHIIVRSWAKKPTSGSSIFSSERNTPLHCILSCLILKNDEVENGEESANVIQENPNCVEFIFEVDDTGKGISKENQNSVFENYVQVEETSSCHTKQGTGLGLGIVQSLVRLMSGEIGIVNKEIRDKGTCFKFNIFLLAVDEIDARNVNVRGDIESNINYISDGLLRHSYKSIITTTTKCEPSHVVLFIQTKTRQQILKKFMESLGVKVSLINEWEQLHYALRGIKHKINLSLYSFASMSKLSLRRRPLSHNNSKDVPMSALDGTDQIRPPFHWRNNLKSSLNIILIVIDTSCGPFRELSKAVAEFKRDLYNTSCRVIWINKPGAQSNIHSKGLDREKIPSNDLIISKPFHGSRLHHVIMLLPEFGGIVFSQEKMKQNLDYQLVCDKEKSSSREKKTLVEQKGEEIQKEGCSELKPLLSGKRVLVAEDNVVLRKVVVTNVLRLGAKVETCENGKQALELVCKGFNDQIGKSNGASTVFNLPYDYILMDCEMPIMDGFEATRRIREEERYYGVYIPVIALTAHIKGEETSKMMKAGMDFHLAKPFKREQLMEAILYNCNNK